MRYAKVNASALARMMKMLMDDEVSSRELAEKTGLSYITILRYIAALHKERVVHIVEFRRDRLGRPCERVFALGNAKDVKRVPKSPLEMKRESRARLKQIRMNQMLAGRLAA